MGDTSSKRSINSQIKTDIALTCIDDDQGILWAPYAICATRHPLTYVSTHTHLANKEQPRCWQRWHASPALPGNLCPGSTGLPGILLAASISLSRASAGRSGPPFSAQVIMQQECRRTVACKYKRFCWWIKLFDMRM